MSKKDLIKPLPKRQPTSDEIDTFVRGGAGKDTEKQHSVSTEIKKSVQCGNCAANSGFAARHASTIQNRMHGGGHENE